MLKKKAIECECIYVIIIIIIYEGREGLRFHFHVCVWVKWIKSARSVLIQLSTAHIQNCVKN